MKKRWTETKVVPLENGYLKALEDLNDWTNHILGKVIRFRDKIGPELSIDLKQHLGLHTSYDSGPVIWRSVLVEEFED